jgi:hypothetical protein
VIATSHRCVCAWKIHGHWELAFFPYAATGCPEESAQPPVFIVTKQFSKIFITSALSAVITVENGSSTVQ